MKKLLIVFFLGLINSAFGAGDASALRLYHEANLAYQKLDYDLSTRLYEQLVKNNQVSVEIFYNLGNSYFKKGDTPKAILNYERALKIRPEDEDILFNLKIASLNVVDKIETVPQVFYKKWISSIAGSLAAATWSVIFIILFWLMFAAAAVYVTGRTAGAKKIAFVMVITLLIFCTVSGVMAAKSHRATYVDETAIIMASSVYVKSSPSEKGNDLFILHEGTKVEIQDQLSGWYKIRIANGNVGWIENTTIEKI